MRHFLALTLALAALIGLTAAGRACGDEPPAGPPSSRIWIDLDHILSGEVNRRGQLVGLHHEPSAPREMVALGERCEVRFEYTSPGTAKDVRTARVRLRSREDGRIVLEKFSTLYPSAWTREEIESAIREAYADAQARGRVDRDGHWEGRARGLRIDGYLTRDGRGIATAYPVYNRPRNDRDRRR